MSLRLAALAGLVTVAAPAAAADQAKIDEAIRKGAEFLRKTHAPNPGYTGGQHGLGQSALAGIAMLEAKVPPNDPALLQVAAFVRNAALLETKTYNLSLALIFLDRLGDPRDVPFIQVLGVRLYRGQNVAGGWTYASWDEVPAVEAQRLAVSLYANPARPKPAGGGQEKPDTGFIPAPKKREDRGTRLHPEAARQLAAVRRDILLTGRKGVGDDNSNTQFGLIGLWVAARNGLPVDDAFALVEARFVRSQNPADGGWSYSSGGSSTPAMTCAGLLGLAAGAALRETKLVAEQPRPADPKPDDPFLNPAKQKPADPAAPPGGPAAPADVREAAVKAGLTALGKVIAATRGGAGAQNYIGHGNWYYVLWSVERVAVAFTLDTIGDIDWYDWGCEYILANQRPDGSWNAAQFADDVNTSFALLFLLKANFVSDLAGKIKDKVKDPGRSELRGGGAAPALFAPPRAEPKKPEPTGAIAPPPDTPPPATGGPLPDVVDTTPADKVAQELAAVTEDEPWAEKLADLKAARGGMNTLALARAVGRVDGKRRAEVRDALAERLTRMTPATLRRLLRDPEPEVRRAAALACGMVDDKEYVGDLIDRLTDPSADVARAAHAALRSLTGKDFGPDPGAADEARVKAATDWRKWFDANRP